jgi:hypothetical protein
MTVISNKTRYFNNVVSGIVKIMFPKNATMKEMLRIKNLYDKGRSILFSEPW